MAGVEPCDRGLQQRDQSDPREQQPVPVATNRDKAAYLNEISLPLREHRAVRNWRNAGMIWAFETESPHRDFAQRCFRLAMDNEMLLRPIGKTVYFMPPYTISKDERDILVNRTLQIIDQLS